MYSNFQQYQQRGGKLPESEYQPLAQRASEIIDYYTAGKAAEATDMASALSACECELVDFLGEGGDTSASSVQSESNDGYSVNYGSVSQAEKTQAMISLLKQYLTFPQNLLATCGWAYV